MKQLKLIYLFLAGILLSLPACEDNSPVPVLGTPDTFVAPVITNAATSSATFVFTPDLAAEEYETFTWDKVDYGANIPVLYTVEISLTTDFANSSVLGKTASASLTISVEDFNNAVLNLGGIAGADTEVFIRIVAVVTVSDVQSMTSTSISRMVNIYQLSECGDFCTIGVIGDATAGGWGIDTDMRLSDPTKVDKNTWTATLYLGVGALKFRADDDWTDNWGSVDFPSGTGTQGGSDIPIAVAGWYKITFNTTSGDYSVVALTPTTYTSISIIGTVNGNWDTDTDLTQDANDPHLWAASVTLVAGKMKLRANYDWAANWGGDTYPSGFSSGNDLTIPTGGTYTVRFHDITGEYSIMNDATEYTTIGVIGSAVDPYDWSVDIDLIKDPSNPYKFSGYITLVDGEAKFRAENAWVVDWGGSSFPLGVASKGGPNVPVKAGKYFVSINTGTGDYNFLN